MSRLVPILLALAWLNPGDAAAQEDTDEQGETSGTPSAGLPDDQKSEALEMPSLSKAQHRWLEPKRSKLPQVPHAQTDFTAHTLEWGETKLGLASITIGALPRTQIGTIPLLDVLGLYNGHVKVKVVQTDRYALGLGTDLYMLQAGEMKAHSLGISMIQSIDVFDPWSVHLGVEWDRIKSSGIPDIEALPSVFTGGASNEDFQRSQKESEWDFHLQEITLSMATDYRFNRRDSLILQASAVFWSKVSEVGYDVPPILGLDEVFNKDIGVSNPIAETYVASLAWQWSWRRTDLRVGVGTSNVPGAWLLQTFDLSYRFGGKTRSTERRMNKTWRRNKSDTKTK